MICLKNIFEQLCNSKHSQFGILAIIRAILFVVNKEIWKTFLKFRLMVLKRDAIKEREITADSDCSTKYTCITKDSSTFPCSCSLNELCTKINMYI